VGPAKTQRPTREDTDVYPNPLKQKLKDGEILLGTDLSVPSPFAAGLILGTRPDFVWIDTEHSAFSTESLEAIPLLARQKGVAPVIRVSWNDPALIKKAFDVGAVVVVVPQVDTPEEAARAVSYARYPPEGKRGVTPLWAIAADEDWDHVIRTANQETVLVLQVESRQAYENLDDIVRVPGIDVLFVGPLDLSASLGRIGETGSREVQDIVRDVPKRLAGTGIAAGTSVDGVADTQERIEWGYRFLCVGNILLYGAQVLSETLEALRHHRAGDG
jgi:4-hydroxy-2-oxoheptanedioate aldolase